MNLRHLLFIGLLLPATASATDLLIADSDQLSTAAWNAARSAQVQSIDAETLTHRLSDADWRVRAEAGALLTWQTEPDRADAVYTEAPRRTRNNRMRFAGDPWRSESAAPVILMRLEHANEASDVRAALVEALAVTRGDWSEGLVAMFETEDSATVRVYMADIMAKADTDAAARGLQLAAADSDPAVRAAAMRGLAKHDVGVELLLEGLRDDSPDVRAFAAQTLGWRTEADAISALPKLLTDADGTVRLHALRALNRIDPGYAADLVVQKSLSADPDSRVARAAQGMLR